LLDDVERLQEREILDSWSLLAGKKNVEIASGGNASFGILALGRHREAQPSEKY
jgi:hypothetical protein